MFYNQRNMVQHSLTVSAVLEIVLSLMIHEIFVKLLRSYPDILSTR